MAVFKVFIDTSALPRDLGRLNLLRKLEMLAQRDILDIYLSEVVVQEWMSQHREKFTGILKEANRAIRKVIKHPWSSEFECTEILRRVQREIPFADIARATDYATRKIHEMLIALNATVLPVAKCHGKQVIASYFAGNEPFEGIKNREDFPDAFIFASALDLIKIPIKTYIV